MPTVRLDVTVRGTGDMAERGSTAQAERAEHEIEIGGQAVDLSASVDLNTGGTLDAPPVDISGSVDMEAEPAVPPVAGPRPVDLSASVNLTAADRVRGLAQVDLSDSVTLSATDRPRVAVPVDLSDSVTLSAADRASTSGAPPPSSGLAAPTGLGTGGGLFQPNNMIRWFIRWGAVTGAASYRFEVERGTDWDGTSYTWSSFTSGSATGTSGSFDAVRSSGAYRFRVRAVSSGGTLGTWSDWYQVTS